MNRLSLQTAPQAKSNLESVIEPLASYICAAGQPRAVLFRALALLVNEVEQINRAAHARVVALAANHGS